MQFNSPFCGTGFPNYKPFQPFNFSSPNYIIHPEVIGEGDVASVIFPDGSVHFYFIPTNKRNVPYCDPNVPTYNPYWNNGLGAFYIRSVSNPMSATVFNQQCQKMYGVPFSRPCLFPDCNLNVPPPAFQLKFHNDSWTSTSDLRYFFPRLRSCEWRPISSPKECAAVQTDIPSECPNVCQPTCAKPCLCIRDSNENQRNTARYSEINIDECGCDKVNKKYSKTSMSSGRSTSKSSKTKLRKKKSKLKCKKHKQKKVVKKTSNVECECREPSTTDKSVTTYADKGSCCTAEERNTQTSPTNCAISTFFRNLKKVVSKGDVKTELWAPKPSSGSKPMDITSSEKIIGVFETDCSSASCCCSATDTDTGNN